MKIIPFIVNTIISPHGITDLSHSLETENTNNLLKIYGINFTLSNFILNDICYDNFINSLLIASSIIHFRHDIPNIKYKNYNIPKYIISFLLISFFVILKSDMIFYYMLFIHVPNHFKLNNFHIKNNKLLNFILYSIFGFILLIIDEKYNYIYDNINLINNLKFIIISHVIYQEKYILNENIKL